MACYLITCKNWFGVFAIGYIPGQDLFVLPNNLCTYKLKKNLIMAILPGNV